MQTSSSFHIIPSVRQIKFLDKAIQSKEEYILLTCAHIGNLKELTSHCHTHHKKVIVNHELIGGLGSDKFSFEMLKKMYHVDVVMGSSPSKLNMAKKEGLKTIRRISLIDSFAFEKVLQSVNDAPVDMIELRPALYAIKFLDQFKSICSCQYAAAGFIEDQKTLELCHSAGYSYTMTSCPSLWG